MAKARNRDRRPGRRAPYRSPQPTILIVCEGECSEPQYFVGFRRACRNPRVDIEIAPEHGVPKTLVNVAKERKLEAERQADRQSDDNLAYDSVWCVFDIDEHPHVAEAKQMARDNRINLAISNPCFELWLLLHFRDNPGMQDRDSIRRMLQSFVPNYDKKVDHRSYSAGYIDAVNRAERMDSEARNARNGGRNPSTRVYKLTRLVAEGHE